MFKEICRVIIKFREGILGKMITLYFEGCIGINCEMGNYEEG